VTHPSVILTDIEGTTTPIAFVHDVLFPYARDCLARLETGRPEIAAILEAVPGADKSATLRAWMDQDAKVTPLKELQGILWRDGYEAGAIKGVLYPDVPPKMHAWHAAGTRLAIYSSGSREAQRLLFTHSDAGDLSALITGYFDTTTGPKREAASYAAIARALEASPGSVLFLSDVEAELDAARDAGLRTTQLVRQQDGTIPSRRHPTAADFTQLP
jgi:enolase-phosphatase E1